MDFTFTTIKTFIDSLQFKEYKLVSVSDYLNAGHNITKQIILRHDVDAFPRNSLDTARMEHELGIRGTYYFRMVPGSYDEAVIREITGLGHEVGYHYETMAQIEKGQGQGQEDHVERAYMLFVENLAKFREIVPVETICMHGSPLSRFDNREIWKKYDYRELGIIGEASMDIDFSKVAYYTDTGRRWDGAGVSIRDKVPSGNRDGKTEKREDNKKEEHKGGRISVIGNRLLSGLLNNTNFKNIQFPLYHTTFEMIKAVEDGTFPKQAMLTIHPQRWNDALIPWAKELVWQNVKNVGKWFIIKLRE